MKNKNDNPDLFSKCSVCGENFNQKDFALLENEDHRTVFHTTCSGCDTSFIMMVTSGQSGVVSLGMVTDLDGKEVLEKFKKEAISADEVIDAHQFTSKGNFIRLVKSINNLKA